MKNLYRWKSGALKRWDRGDIIVCATDVNEAREKVRGYVRKYYDDTYFDSDEINEKVKEIEKDIFIEPCLFADDVLFIQGSE